MKKVDKRLNAAAHAQTLIDLIIEETSGLDALGRRIVANRIVGVLSGWLPTEKKDRIEAGVLVPMTDAEARTFGATAMLFGRHAGKRVDEVELGYLCWLADASRATWRDLARYLRSPRIASELSYDD